MGIGMKIIIWCWNFLCTKTTKQKVICAHATTVRT